MPTITAIKQQKREGRVNIYLDGKFAFGIDLENFIKHDLRIEQELTTKEIAEITGAAELQKTYEKILRFAMLRPRSEKELTDWLKRKKTPEEMHGRLFKKLKKLDLIDDEKFARWWVDQRLEFKPRGTRALASELYQKGIDRQIIQDVLENTEMDEVAMAKELVKKNAYKWKRYDEQKRKEKMQAFLARKGFNWDVIREIKT